MASFTIKNIPDELYEQLKLAAQAHHRSINSELIVCLEKVLLPAKTSTEDRLSTARSLRERVKTPLIDPSEIDDAKRANRP